MMESEIIDLTVQNWKIRITTTLNNSVQKMIIERTGP